MDIVRNQLVITIIVILQEICIEETTVDLQIELRIYIDNDIYFRKEANPVNQSSLQPRLIMGSQLVASRSLPSCGTNGVASHYSVKGPAYARQASLL